LKAYSKTRPLNYRLWHIACISSTERGGVFTYAKCMEV